MFFKGKFAENNRNDGEFLTNDRVKPNTLNKGEIKLSFWLIFSTENRKN